MSVPVFLSVRVHARPFELFSEAAAANMVGQETEIKSGAFDGTTGIVEEAKVVENGLAVEIKVRIE